MRRSVIHLRLEILSLWYDMFVCFCRRDIYNSVLGERPAGESGPHNLKKFSIVQGLSFRWANDHRTRDLTSLRLTDLTGNGYVPFVRRTMPRIYSRFTLFTQSPTLIKLFSHLTRMGSDYYQEPWPPELRINASLLHTNCFILSKILKTFLSSADFKLSDGQI